MNVVINLYPKEVWEYYKSNREAFRSGIVEVASCEDFGISICVTETLQDKLMVIVEADGYEVFCECIYSELDCELTLKKVYNTYLTEDAISEIPSCESSTVPDEPPEELLDKNEIKHQIDDREEELSEAFTEVINTILCSDYVVNQEDFADIVEDLKERSLEYLARKHNIRIYRPMYLEDEDGEDFFEEYPYECMIFEDEEK